MTERMSEFVIPNLSDITDLGSERRKTGNCISCRAARKLHARTHQFTKLLRSLLIYQSHCGFRHLKPSNRRIIRRGDDVNDRVSDPGYVKRSSVHDLLLSVDVGLWRLAGKRIYPVHRFLRAAKREEMRLDQAKVGLSGSYSGYAAYNFRRLETRKKSANTGDLRRQGTCGIRNTADSSKLCHAFPARRPSEADVHRCAYAVRAKALRVSNDDVRGEAKLTDKPAFKTLFGRKSELALELTFEHRVGDPRVWFRVGCEPDLPEAMSRKKPRFQHRTAGCEISGRGMDIPAEQ
jgi:hypothetical protein